MPECLCNVFRSCGQHNNTIPSHLSLSDITYNIFLILTAETCTSQSVNIVICVPGSAFQQIHPRVLRIKYSVSTKTMLTFFSFNFFQILTWCCSIHHPQDTFFLVMMYFIFLFLYFGYDVLLKYWI